MQMKKCVPGTCVIRKDSRPLKMGPICCSETSVKSYHYTLRDFPEEQHRSHRLRSGSLKSHEDDQ